MLYDINFLSHPQNLNNDYSFTGEAIGQMYQLPQGSVQWLLGTSFYRMTGQIRDEGVYRDIGKMLHAARRGRLITSRISPQGLVAHVPVLKENKMSLMFPSWGPAAYTCYFTHAIPTPLHMHLFPYILTHEYNGRFYSHKHDNTPLATTDDWCLLLEYSMGQQYRPHLRVH